jgi:hypothetical protein
VRCAAGHHFRMAADQLTIFNGGAAEAESGLGEKAAPVRHPPEPVGFHNLVAVSARRLVVPLHGTRGFTGGLKGLIMPGACRNQAERLGWCPCRRRAAPVTGWLAAWSHDLLV